MSPSRFYYRMLGTVELVDSTGTPVEPLAARPKALALLAFIVLSSRGAPCSRDTLLAHFWPDLSTRRARHALRQALYEIRQALGEDVLELRGRHEVALSRTRFAADVLDLFDALDSGRLDDVVALFRGELLPGLHVKGAREFDAWLLGEREGLNRAASGALWRDSRRLVQLGDVDAAVARGRQALVHDPFNERGLRDLMTVLYESGRSVEALGLYRAFRTRVLREIGIQPGKETEALAEQCKRGNGPDSRHAGPPSAVAGPAPSNAPAGSEEPEPVPDGDPATVDTLPGRRRTPSAVQLATILLSLVVLSLLVLSFMKGPKPGQEQRITLPPEDGPALSVAVVPAANARDRRATAMLAEGVAILLSTDEQAGVLALIDDPSSGSLPARTTIVVSAQADPSSAWDAQLVVRAFRRAAPVFSARMRRGEFRALLEAVMDTLRPAAGLGDRPARWDLLPANDAALDAFARGRQLAAQGEHHAAVAAYERAVRLDGDFALGWYRLATMPAGAFDAPVRREAERQAEGTGGRLPRAEMVVLEAQRAYRAGEPQKAEAILRSLLVRHPYDADATYQLAEVLVHYNPIRGRPLNEARRLLEQGLRVEPNRPEALDHLCQLYLLDGDTAAFDRTADRLLKAGAGYRTSQIRLVKARVDGDVEEWHDNLAKLASDRDFTILSTAHFLAVYAGDVAAAFDVLAILKHVDRDPAVRSRAHVFSAELEAAQGNAAAAVREFDMAMALDAEHAASRAANLMALGVLPTADSAVAGLARRIIEAPTLPTLDVADWLDVESDLRPWLIPYARAAAHLALGESHQASALLVRLNSYAGASRGARLLAANLGALLDVPPVESSIPWWGVTPTEAILSPFYSLAATRLMNGRRAIAAGHNRQAELWFGSLLDQSIPDLALAQIALAGESLALDRSGAAAAAAAARQRMAHLQELASSH